MPKRHQGGFTLFELMVACAIFILLSALAIPAFQTYFEKSRVRGAADDAVTLIANARQTAVKFDREVSVATTGTGATWCLGAAQAPDFIAGDQSGAAVACDCAGTPSACKVDGVDESIVRHAKFSGVTLASAAGELVFDGRLGLRSDASVGSADASSFDLVSSSGLYTLTVAVSPLGQATVCSKSGNILGYPQC